MTLMLCRLLPVSPTGLIYLFFIARNNARIAANERTKGFCSIPRFDSCSGVKHDFACIPRYIYYADIYKSPQC